MKDFYKPLINERRKSSASEELGNETEKAKKIKEMNKEYDFDNPDAIDWDLLIKGIKMLKERKPFNKPLYDINQLSRISETEKVIPQDVIIVDGTLIFTNESLIDLFDLKIYIDTDDDIRLSLRILKKIE